MQRSRLMTTQKSPLTSLYEYVKNRLYHSYHEFTYISIRAQLHFRQFWIVASRYLNKPRLCLIISSRQDHFWSCRWCATRTRPIGIGSGMGLVSQWMSVAMHLDVMLSTIAIAPRLCIHIMGILSMPTNFGWYVRTNWGIDNNKNSGRNTKECRPYWNKRHTWKVGRWVGSCKEESHKKQKEVVHARV